MIGIDSNNSPILTCSCHIQYPISLTNRFEVLFMLPCRDCLTAVLRDQPRPFHSSSVACKHWATAQHCRRSMGIPCLGIAATALWTLCVTYCLAVSLPAHSWWAGATPCNALPDCVYKVRPWENRGKQRSCSLTKAHLRGLVKIVKVEDVLRDDLVRAAQLLTSLLFPSGEF